MKITEGVKRSRLVFMWIFLAAALGAAACNRTSVAAGTAAADPLPSWNDGPSKRAILDLVKATTDRSGARFVPLDDRIATFDQDGTLWVEHPLYTQGVFALDRVRSLAPKHPEWQKDDTFKAILGGDEKAIGKFVESDWEKILAVTHSGMTTEAFLADVESWLASAKHPRFNRPYTELVYQPMLEAMRLLRANGFKTYIVTGGGQEFVRAYAARVYGVPPEQVIGSALETKYEVKDGKPALVREKKILLDDNHGGKPVGINLFIGKRPIAAFGNSSGDAEMLAWTAASGKGGTRLMMLVHHDDAQREYAYGPAGGLPDTKVGTFPYALMKEAKAGRWHVVSMKNDWKQIFAFEQLAMTDKRAADSESRP
jgi:phosphoglycolate phosphatase-like HAD superfamily hydrolase